MPDVGEAPRSATSHHEPASYEAVGLNLAVLSPPRRLCMHGWRVQVGLIRAARRVGKGDKMSAAR
jgi:hypothetical protein